MYTIENCVLNKMYTIYNVIFGIKSVPYVQSSMSSSSSCKETKR